LGPTDNTWSFQVVDDNHDGRPDLAAFHTSGTQSGTTEIHILNGASNFQSFLLHSTTALGPTVGNGYLRLADFNGDGALDLVYVSPNNTGSGMTEVHVLNGSAGFQTFLAQIATSLGSVASGANFFVGSFNGDGQADLYFLPDDITGSGDIEVHILSRRSNYQTWLLQAATSYLENG
jgi:hypothetical protein